MGAQTNNPLFFLKMKKEDGRARIAIRRFLLPLCMCVLKLAPGALVLCG